MAQKKFSGILGWVLISLSGLAIALIVYLSQARKKNPEKWIRKGLKKNNLAAKEIDLWVAVSKLESDDYKSDLCSGYYNPFGMTVPSKRESVSNGKVYMESDSNWFQVYSNFPQSVTDLLYWITYTDFDLDISDPDEFVSELKKRGYFTSSASGYLAGIKSYL